MGILEIAAEMLKLSGYGEANEPRTFLAGALFLIAVLLLVLNLRPPRKGDRFF